MPATSFVDESGNPIETINRDQPFRIQADLGHTDGPETLDVTFGWDDGSESDTFTITKMPDGTYSSTTVTASRGSLTDYCLAMEPKVTCTVFGGFFYSLASGA